MNNRIDKKTDLTVMATTGEAAILGGAGNLTHASLDETHFLTGPAAAQWLRDRIAVEKAAGPSVAARRAAARRSFDDQVGVVVDALIRLSPHAADTLALTLWAERNIGAAVACYREELEEIHEAEGGAA